MSESYITLIRGVPLGDHLGPGVQPGGAFDGQFPKRSLGGVCEEAEPRWIWEVDGPSHNVMNRSMWPRFQVCLETQETTFETVYQGHLTLRRECVRQDLVRVIGRTWCIPATEPVGRGIRDDEVIGECTVGNLIVIVGVTPTSHPASGIGIPESAVLKIRRVCHKY